jgi:Flp pilus assembly protein CpaB
MEMEFKYAGRRRRLLLIVVGVLLAVGAGWASLMLASANNHPAAPTQTQPVLVAARDIPARATLTADDVAIRTVPVDEVLPQSYSDPNQVIGRVSAVPVYTDQQMTPNLFATTDANSDFSILGPDETVSPDSPVWRAIALQVSPQQAVGGDIQAGDHVDIIVSVQFNLLAQNPDGTYVKVDTATSDGLMSGTSTKISMQDIEVLKVDPNSNIYTLKVDLAQAEQIAQIIQEAPDSFTIVLRPGDDTRAVDPSQYGVTDDRLILTYLYPVPQLFDPHELLNPPTPVPGSSPSLAPVASPSPSSAPETSPEPSPSSAP